MSRITIAELLAFANNVEANQAQVEVRERELAEDPSKAEKPASAMTSTGDGKFSLFNTEEQYKARQGANAVLVVGALRRDLAVELIKKQGLGEPMPVGTMPDYYWGQRTLPGFAVAVFFSNNIPFRYTLSCTRFRALSMAICEL
jgi:hypothetical protein